MGIETKKGIFALGKHRMEDGYTERVNDIDNNLNQIYKITLGDQLVFKQLELSDMPIVVSNRGNAFITFDQYITNDIDNSKIELWSAKTDPDSESTAPLKLVKDELIKTYRNGESLLLEQGHKYIIRANFSDWTAVKGNDSVVSNVYDLRCIKEISLANLTNVQQIGDNFFRGLEDLDTLYLGDGLKKTASIGTNVFKNLSINTNGIILDLRGFSNLNTIRHGFCGGANLNYLYLRGTTKLNSIGDSFLAEVKKLPQLNMSYCSSLQSIGNGFLKNIESLKRVDLPLTTNNIPTINESPFNTNRQLQCIVCRNKYNNYITNTDWTTYKKVAFRGSDYEWVDIKDKYPTWGDVNNNNENWQQILPIEEIE